ncbi:M20/M25/M40 family metallo-hydrolase [Streptomyces galbus]|uniref:M20 family dipeptidase n=1 Tax=Streptomyces galbus TaxID=33898 RepID=A0A4U5W685_STRGB|nr:M20/M25/M40 family metallo-hydrolase [Streptomyces galbus]TKS97007.1 M20 family dipeptidase [Streptomyces galbus]GHD51230.1 peptidase [Streptomyces galbus]
MQDADPAVHDYLHDRVGTLLDGLAAWVRVPSVSADPAHERDVTRSARWLQAHLRETGFPEVEEWDSDGLQTVFGCWPAEDPDAPTLLVYSHHDVRAVKDQEWQEVAPFAPALRQGRMYGRGTSDAKGQVLAHVWALRAHLEATGRGAPAVTLKYLIEGEEEVGSPHLADVVREHADRLAADVVVVSDTMLWSLEEPAVCTGVRGSLNAHLEVRGPRRDVHSGVVAGAAPNPLTELCRLAGLLHDDQGRITLPGFYDSVAEPTAEERRGMAAVPFDTDDWLDRTRSRSVQGEAGFGVLERVWTRPAAEVVTLLGGDPDDPARGVVPAVASADLTLRLVPDQKADTVMAQLRTWVAEQIRDGFAYELTTSPTNQDPYVTPPGHPALASLEDAMSRTLQRPAYRIRNGGGAPAALLAEVLGAPALFFGTGLPEDHWHDSDEKAEVQALVQGAETLAYLLEDLPRRLRA